jgi:hypothetical protein
MNSNKELIDVINNLIGKIDELNSNIKKADINKNAYKIEESAKRFSFVADRLRSSLIKY